MGLVGGVVIGGGGCQREGCVGDLDVGTTDTGKMGKLRRCKNANMNAGSRVKTTKTAPRSGYFQLGSRRSNTHSIRSKRSARRFVSGDDLKFARREDWPHLEGGVKGQ